jgi:PIN domain nuclease of toxin-antitoxin system
MRALLDTHAFLWWIDDHPKLSLRAREFIKNGDNELFFSSVSAWEIIIKSQLGRLDIPENPEAFISKELAINSIHSLPLHINHALHIYRLPHYHRDPFDRILVAQALVEKLPILTADQKIFKYPVKIIW